MTRGRRRGRTTRSTRIKKYPHGGMHNGNGMGNAMSNGCPNGMMMGPDGNCIPMNTMNGGNGIMRRGGRTKPMPKRKFAHGGSHGGCPAGMMMAANGGCVPMSGGVSGGYRRGGKSMAMGGVLNHSSGMPVGDTCPPGFILGADGTCNHSG